MKRRSSTNVAQPEAMTIPVVLLLPEPLHLTAEVVEFLVLEPDLKPALTLLQTLIDQFLDVVGR